MLKLCAVTDVNTGFVTKSAHISDVGYSFLSSHEAEKVSWFCKTCKDPARMAVLEDKCNEDKCKRIYRQASSKTKTHWNQIYKRWLN